MNGRCVQFMHCKHLPQEFCRSCTLPSHESCIPVTFARTNTPPKEIEPSPHAQVFTCALNTLPRSQPCNAGMLLCPACGRFYGGERGLRTHQQVKHASDYGAAKEVVESAKQQLIVRPPSTVPNIPAAQQATSSDSTQLSVPQPGAAAQFVCFLYPCDARPALQLTRSAAQGIAAQRCSASGSCMSS
jgi:hypothetical protein